MNRSEAIEILESIYPSKSQIGLGEYDHLAESLDMAIQALETIEKGVVPVDWHNDVYETIQKRYIDLLERTRWIPVSERLPTEDDSDENGYVLVWNKNGRGTWNWRDVVFHNRIVKITHWMPLPEPPQEVE